MKLLFELINQITPLDENAMSEAQLRLDNLTKPVGSLGVLEHIARKLAGALKTSRPAMPQKAALVVVDDRRTPHAAESLCRFVGAPLYCVQNTSQGVKAGEEEIINAFHQGIEAANKILDTGVQVVGIGIWNTELIKSAKKLANSLLFLHNGNPGEVVNCLTDANAGQIAVLTGVILTCTARRSIVVLDGFASAVAALAAFRLSAETKEYLLASQAAVEQNHNSVLSELGLTGSLRLNMAIDDGSGAVLGLTLVDAGVKVLNEMATFDEAKVAYALGDIK